MDTLTIQCLSHTQTIPGFVALMLSERFRRGAPQSDLHESVIAIDSYFLLNYNLFV